MNIKEAFDAQRISEVKDEIRRHKEQIKYSKKRIRELEERLARMLAAEKMGLIKDVYGENLPHELWSQCIPEARKQLGLE